MAENNSLILLQDALFQQEEILQTNREYIKILNRENIPILCINRSAGIKRYMPFGTLYENNDSFWEQIGNWEYFINRDDFKNVLEKATAKTGLREARIEVMEQQADETEKPVIEQGYGKEAEAVYKMTGAERVQKIEKNKQHLNDLIIKKVRDPKIITGVLVKTTKDAALINHAALMDVMNIIDNEAKKQTQSLVDSTCEMVKYSAQLISEDLHDEELMNALVEKSNGTIVQHMTRVYLNGISFLAFYNRLVSTSSSTINRLRISFAEKYRNYYHFLLPHMTIDAIHLERVFFKGMMAIPQELFYHWAVGFLVHDIGKTSAVEYHEGEADYDRDIAVEHVKLGYTSVMNKTNYPREAGLITGYHHEYYGNNSGYGYFRAYLEQHKKINPGTKQDYCITYELAPMLDYIALAYFPAKVLEIMDIYDSVTDPTRKNHKAMAVEEAIEKIREEFIVKHRRIDPILFDIFEAFMNRKQKKQSKAVTPTTGSASSQNPQGL